MTPIPQRRTRMSARVAAVCALAVATTGLTGCGSDPDEGTNGVGKLEPAQIRDRATKAVGSADSVHLSGTVITKDGGVELDMRLSDGGGRGEVTSGGTTFGLLRVGEDLYLQAGADFWNQAAGGDGKGLEGTTAEKLDGKYVKVPEKDPAYQRFSGFTDMDSLLDGLLGLEGKPAKDGYHEVGDARTIRLMFDEGAAGRLDVSLKGTPFPLRLERPAEGGTLQFADWNKGLDLKEPPKDEQVDYGQDLPET
ncbi:hypothetical protein [Streptomyces abyssomicinicus]|uniref:hypothetical protein n=1 Tax=Streptomyces abyssomicinicus TaxID=574929 RepID=UPI0012509890